MSSRDPRPRRRRTSGFLPRGGEAGYTLLELAVATLVLSVLLLFVAQGLREAQGLFLRSQRRLVAGSTELAFTYLRQDARSARSASGSASVWRFTPLVLAQPDGSSVTYRADGDRLDRVVSAQAGRPELVQTVARQVLSFRWRRPAVGLVEAEIVLRPPPRPPRLLDRSAPRPLDGSPVERATFALRSRPRTEW